MVPYAVKELNQGGLVIIDHCMLPFVRAVIEKTRCLVCEEKCRELGQNVIQVAKMEIKNDESLYTSFIVCVKHCGVDSSLPVVRKIFDELSLKLFHARVNQFMTATIELDLKKSGKAVKADQSLRDQLKTYSAMKTRSPE